MIETEMTHSNLRVIKIKRSHQHTHICNAIPRGLSIHRIYSESLLPPPPTKNLAKQRNGVTTGYPSPETDTSSNIPLVQALPLQTCGSSKLKVIASLKRCDEKSTSMASKSIRDPEQESCNMGFQVR